MEAMDAVDAKNRLVIFSKAPLPGRSKKRLAAGIGELAAAELAKAMLADLIIECRQVKEAELQIFYPPGFQVADFAMLPVDLAGISFQQQEGRDLGERLRNAFDLLLRVEKAEKVIVIGADCVTHSKRSLRQVFQFLDEYDVVVQPAIDGGYVLVAQQSFTPIMFDDISWGSSQAFRQTIGKLRGVRYKVMDSSFDIDSHDDLQQLHKFLTGNVRDYCSDFFRRWNV